MKNKTDKGNVILYEFKTMAQDESGKRKVYITQGKDLGNDAYKGKVLSIEDTPGAWYIDDLVNFHTPSSLTYDTHSISGKDWNCLNWQEIVKELKETI